MQEVTVQSWGTRLKESVVGILVGFLLIGVAIYLIFWNENNNFHMALSLGEAKKGLISVAPSPIKASYNSRVVYVTGLAVTTDKLQDSLLNIDLIAIALIRKVEMYQWQEEEKTRIEKQLGGSERTVKAYTYKKIWSEQLVDSSTFKETSYQNPTVMPAQSQRLVASPVTLGDFTLSPGLIEKISLTTPVALSNVNLTALKTQFKKPVRLIELMNNQLYVGQDSKQPQLGDLRISVVAVLPQQVSVIAQQVGNTLQSYSAAAGGNVLLLASGKVSSDAMIKEAQDENRMTTWVLRFAALAMMIIGFSLIMRPLIVLADVLPFVGTLVEFGTGLIATVIGFCLWTIFLAIAWFTIRPFFAIGLLMIVAIIMYLFWISRSEKARGLANNPRKIS